MKKGREVRLGDRLVEHIGAPVVRVEALHRGMKLKAADAEVADQPPRLPRPALALGRIDAGEWDQDIAVGGGLFGDFFVRVTAITGLALGIDRKDHSPDLAFAIVARGFFDGRPIVWLIEIDG